MAETLLLLNTPALRPPISRVPSIPSHSHSHSHHHRHRHRCHCCGYDLQFTHAFPLHRRPSLPERYNNVLRCSSSSKSSSSQKEPGFRVLTAINSLYNNIVILDTAESRMLLLDPTYNVHSVFMKGQVWTGSYWDEFASLPAVIPKGPIAIFGLGGGTAAHLILTLWPSLQLEGWEIDQILIDKAREHLGLADLEKHTEGGGILNVHVDDALSTSSTISGGYAGIIVDLFSGGEVLPQLQQEQTWLELYGKLMPNGRFMVNCGGISEEAFASSNESTHPGHSSVNGIWKKNSTLNTMCKAFPGQVSWKKMPKDDGENFLALTGPLPDLTTWAAALPDRLSAGIILWTSCFPSS